MAETAHQLEPASLLPAPTLADLRLTRAQLARLFGCSKQAVSEWVRKGVLTIGGDDRIGAVEAVRQYFERGDVDRMRVRVLREVARDITAQGARIRELERSLAVGHDAHATAQRTAGFAFKDAQALQLAALADAIAERFDELAAARAAGFLGDALDELIAGIFYPDEANAIVTDAPPPREGAAAVGDPGAADPDSISPRPEEQADG